MMLYYIIQKVYIKYLYYVLKENYIIFQALIILKLKHKSMILREIYIINIKTANLIF